MKVSCIEHIDIFNPSERVFWLIVENVPDEFIKIAKEIDKEEYVDDYFGICVINSNNEWDICQDSVDHELFYIDTYGEKQWMEYSLNSSEKEGAIKFCKDYINKQFVEIAKRNMKKAKIAYDRNYNRPGVTGEEKENLTNNVSYTAIVYEMFARSVL